MMKSKFAFIFLVVAVVALKSSEGKHIHDIKEDIKVIGGLKAPLVAAKVGIATSVAAKIKLVAAKKLAAAKAIAKAPFVLGKKLALLKIGAVKSLAALKVAKAKKVFNYASAKTGPAVAAVAAIPAVVAGIPAAAIAAIKPFAAIKPIADIKPIAAIKPIAEIKPVSKVPLHTQVVDIYTIPVSHSQQHYQISHPKPASSYHSGSYKSGLEGPRTFENDYSLVPGSGANNNYEYYPVVSSADSQSIEPHSTYGVPY